MSENLKYTVLEPGIGQITISQPEKRNALSAAMWEALPVRLNQAAADNLKVLIVTGEGAHFSSGADITEFGTLYATPQSAAKISADISAGFNALADFPVPTVAKIRGTCVGGGCGLALCCDIRFADSASRFAITPAKLGLVYPFDDVARLIEAVGMANAKDMLFSARVLKAKPAKKMGLINTVSSVDDLDADVAAYAHGIAALSRESAQVTKRMFAAYSAGQRKSSPESQADFLAGFSSADFQEGYTAFLEKRKANFL